MDGGWMPQWPFLSLWFLLVWLTLRLPSCQHGLTSILNHSPLSRSLPPFLPPSLPPSPQSSSMKRPVIPTEFGAKVPTGVRQRYLNLFIDECLKFCSSEPTAFQMVNNTHSTHSLRVRTNEAGVMVCVCVCEQACVCVFLYFNSWKKGTVYVFTDMCPWFPIVRT